MIHLATTCKTKRQELRRTITDLQVQITTETMLREGIEVALESCEIKNELANRELEELRLIKSESELVTKELNDICSLLSSQRKEISELQETLADKQKTICTLELQLKESECKRLIFCDNKMEEIKEYAHDKIEAKAVSKPRSKDKSSVRV